MSYYFSKVLDTDIESAIVTLKEELQKEGFGVLTDIDVKATFKKKLDVDFRNYRILGACNPPSAYKAIGVDDKVGTMLPCNVIVQEIDSGKVEIAAINPVASMISIENDALTEIAGNIRDKLKKVIDSL